MAIFGGHIYHNYDLIIINNIQLRYIRIVVE
jgi:hypothetical protein